MPIRTSSNNRLLFTDEQIEQANNVNLLTLARHYGYELEDKERKAYHAKHSGGLFFFKNSNTFEHFSSGTVGGAINFVMMKENLNYVEAVKRLLSSSFEPMREVRPRQYVPQQEKNELMLPEKAPNFKRAYWYLTGHRGIAPAIVSAMMNENKIYQDKRGNCVFIGYDENNKPKYCAKRGTYPDSPYKRDEGGSDKSYPFHMAGRRQKVYVFEAPIDAMSHATLTMLYSIDWRLDHRISLGCLSDKALGRFLKWNNITEIVFAFDNDFDGKEPVQATQEEYEKALKSGDASDFSVADNGRINKLIPCNWGQQAAISSARKYKALGYKVAIHTPQDNDFNADLVNYRRAAAARESETEEAVNDYELEA